MSMQPIWDFIVIVDSITNVTHFLCILMIVLAQAEPQQMWDCEAFTEMLVAYLPQSEGIPVSFDQYNVDNDKVIDNESNDDG